MSGRNNVRARKRAVVLALAVAGLSSSARGSTFTWTAGASANWDDTGNWSHSGPANVPQNNTAVLFPSPVPGTNGSAITMSNADAANTLEFDDNYSLGSGALSIQGGFIFVAPSKTATIATTLTSTSTLDITGGGAVELTTSNNAYTGGWQVDAGTLRLDAVNALGSAGFSSVPISNATVEVNNIPLGRALTFHTGAILRGLGTSYYTSAISVDAAPASATLSTGASSSDLLNITDGGSISGGSGATLHITGSGIVNLADSNGGYTGSWSVDSGTLRVSNANALGTSQTAFPVSSTLEVNGVSASQNTTLNNGSTVRGLGAAALTGNATVAPSASLTLASGSNTTDVLTMNDATHGLAGGSGATIHISGNGAVNLAGNSSYSGAWTIDSGTLRVSNTNATGSGTSAIPLANAAALEINNVSWGRNLTMQSGSTLRGAGSAMYISTATLDSGASVTLASGTSAADLLNLGGTSLLTGGGSGATIHVDGAGTVQLNQPSTVITAWSIDGGTLKINDQSELGSSNALTVNAATLDLTSMTNSYTVGMNTGATLRAHGTVVQSGNIIAAVGASVTLATGGSASDSLSITTPDAVLGGAGAVIHVNGSGVVDLTQSNSFYNDGWQVDGGTLRVDNTFSTGIGTSAIPIASGGAVEINNLNWNRDLTLQNGSTLRGTRNATYSGTVTVDPSASVTLASGTASTTDQLAFNDPNSHLNGGSGATIHVGGVGTVEMLEPMNYSGDWSVDNGTLMVGAANTTGTGTSAIVVSGDGVLQLNASTFSRDVTLNGGAMMRASTTTNLSGRVQLAFGVATVFVDSGVTLTTSGNISSSGGSLTKFGPGTLVTAAANTIGGPTVGTLSVIDGSFNLVGGETDEALLRIGTSPPASFVQTGGTHVVSGSGAITPMELGIGAGTGVYNLSGGLLNVINSAAGVNGEAVGFNGTGTFIQSGGSHTITGSNANLAIGLAAGSTGVYTISAGSLTANSLDVAHDSGAQGTLTVNGGTVTLAANLQLGLAAAGATAASGTINANAGSITAQGIYVGGTSSGAGGAGVLNVAGGSVTSTGALRLWNTSGSAINLSAGSLTCGSFDVSGNPSRFVWTGGTFKMTGNTTLTFSVSGALPTNQVISATSSLIASTISIANAQPTILGSLAADLLDDNGSLTVSSGSVNVTTFGAGNSGTLTGGLGTGSVSITGGTFTATNVYLGSTAGGTGQMTLGGTGTLAVYRLAANDLTINGGTVTQAPADALPPGPLDGALVGGYLHNGAINIHGGSVTIGAIKLGLSAGFTGSYLQDGGVVNVTTFGVGNDGTNSGGSGVGSALIEGGTLNATNLIIGSTSGGSGTIGLKFDSNLVLKTANISFNGTGSNRLDLANNKLIVTTTKIGSWNGGSYDGVTGMIASGRNAGPPGAIWGGSGIVTSETSAGLGSQSTTLAIASASDVGYGGTKTFAGQSVNPTDVLVMYTYTGDANLDGKINADDYFQIDSHYNKNGINSAKSWFNGDFNYDGQINGDDYFLIDNAFAAQHGNVFPSAPAFTGVTAVPEPAGLACLSLVGGIIFRRRRARIGLSLG